MRHLTARACALLMLVLLGAACRSGDGTPQAETTTTVVDTRFPDPLPVEMAPPVDGTRDWLLRDGAPLVAALRATAPLISLPAAADRVDVCTQVALDLDAIGSPSDLSRLASDAPGNEGTIPLTNDLAAKNDLLAACGAPGPDLERNGGGAVHARHREAVDGARRRRYRMTERSRARDGTHTTGATSGVRCRAALVTLAIMATVLASVGPLASATSTPSGRVSWWSTGDSYSSGEGVPHNQGACAQSQRAWGPTAAAQLRTQRWSVPEPVVFTACTGHHVEDLYVRNDARRGSLLEWAVEQAGGGQPRFDLITLTISGNDLGFADVLIDCYAPLGHDVEAGGGSWIDRVRNGTERATGCDVTEDELRTRLEAFTADRDNGGDRKCAAAARARRRPTGF